MNQIIFKYIFLTLVIAIVNGDYASRNLKCHVCEAVVDEMESAISKVGTKKMADIGGARLDSKGNLVSKSVPLVKSEIYLSELLENVCSKMDEYVKVKHKTTGRYFLMKIMVDGHMNPQSSEVEFVQDGDLNKTVGHLCLELVEEHDEALIKEFQKEELEDDMEMKICSQIIKICDDVPMQDDYQLESEDEYRNEL